MQDSSVPVSSRDPRPRHAVRARHTARGRHSARRRVRPVWASVLLLVLLAFVVPAGVALLLGFGFSLVGFLLSW